MQKLIYTLILSVTASAISAAPVDDARKLYREGNYEQAVAILQPVVKKSPRNGNANYWYGASLLALGRTDEAIAPLERAVDRNVPEAALALAKIATENYEASDARDYYDKYESMMAKARRDIPEEVAGLQSKLVMMENMLSRVEKIAVIDSIVVDADGFFKHYRLSPASGSLVSGETVHLPNAEVAFVPQNNTEILYADADSLGNFVLMGADILDDGSIDHPRPLEGDELNGGGNAEYPFLMADGLTLYYANDGDGSLGGYDIFLTRRGDDGYLQPQNIGMPYNSPYDDYLMAIDETTGAGWWATDRNRIPGKVTIYTFIPSDNRVNVDSDDPNLISLARLSDISLTREPGRDYTLQLPEPGERADSPAQKASSDFELPIGSATKIYHRISDFKSAGARQAMSRAINARAEISNIEKRLDELREAYRNGDHSRSADIQNLEHRLHDARSEYARFTNTAIAEELKN